MAVNTKETLTFFTTLVGAIKDGVVLFLQERRVFERHCSTNVIIGGVDVGLGKPKVAQQIKGWIIQLGCRNTQRLGAEFPAQRPLVHHEANVEGGWQRGFDLVQFGRAETMTDQ